MKTPLPYVKEGRGLTSWVASSLREAILNDHFEPGEKIDQDLIAVELNVSRTPIREALKVLETEGYIDIKSFHGAFVPTITRQDIREVYEVRQIIESEMTRQATTVIPDLELEDLKNLLRQDRLALDTGVCSQHHVIDQYFHETIARYCQNKLFVEIIEKINSRIVRVRNFAQHQPGIHLEISYKEHEAILEAMIARDAEKAARMMWQHLQGSALRIEEFTR